MTYRFRVVLVLFVALLIPVSASAHTGVALGVSGLAAGWMHPFSGLDHMLAMLSVGLWAATMGGRATWRVPAAFVVMLVGGALLGMGGLHLPMVESLITASVLVLGLAITFALRVPLATGIGLVGLFALFHGYAHGAELPLAVSAVQYLVGMTAASIVLHLTGVAIAYGLRAYPRILQGSGALVALSGAWLFAMG